MLQLTPGTDKFKKNHVDPSPVLPYIMKIWPHFTKVLFP